jgi:hypothetical protein
LIESQWVPAMLEEFRNEKVVIDLRGEYVCLGTLTKVEAEYFEIRNADLHDLRDTDTSRENYVASSVSTGIKRNRKRVILFRNEVVAVSLLSDVVAS